MKRMITSAVMTLLALSLVMPASAQSSNWSLYLYNNFISQLIRVFLDGTQETYDLEIPPSAYFSPPSIDFTSDGNRMVSCRNDNLRGSGGWLVIQNVDGSGTPINKDFGAAQGCWVKYSADESQIAVGLARYYVGSPIADTSVPPWALIVIVATTGEQLYEINSSKMSASFDHKQTIMPWVRYFANNRIIFAALPWETDGSSPNPAYLWQLSDDSIQPIDRWWHSGLNSLTQTGELVWTDLDPMVPAAQPWGPVSQANTVRLADKTGQEHVIYTNSDWILMAAEFIDNGRQLAISELEGVDASGNPGEQATRWVALDRSGNIRELATSPGYLEVAPAPDGYVILTASDGSATPVMTLEYHTGRETTTLWQQKASNSISWTLLWVAPTPTADGLQPFPTVTP